MHEHSFVVADQIDRIYYVNALFDSECDFYAIIDFKFIRKNNLQRIVIDSYTVSDFEEKKEKIDVAVRFDLDVEENEIKEV